jgi:hypothetical protein
MGLLDDAIREHLDLKRRRGADPGEVERLEREALGPVRREPMPSAAVPHLEVEPDHLEPAYDQLHDEQFHDDQFVDDTSHLAPPHADPVQPEEPAAPKRGFLRRTRPSSLSAPGPVDFEQHLAAQGEHPGHALHPDDAATQRFDVGHTLDEHEPQHEPQYEHEPQHEPAGEPPSLTFNSPPPKRPRFDGEASSPSAPPADEQVQRPPVADPGPSVAPAPAQPGPAEPDHGAETHEWDVEHAFAAEDSGQPAPPATEDVLEETPEFLQDTPDHDRLWFEQRPPRDFDFDG